ncbi:MAG: Crp/Fnr family transcriptional regulator [Hyphomonadaceae bacterium]|nr:Crp/Fnr family transcriptional regulator [Hyphomonadaceae bacterium]
MSDLTSLARQNRLLAALPPGVLQRLEGYLEPVELQTDQVIYHPDAPIKRNYFLTRGLVSLVKTMKDGRTVEIGAFGREGMTGPDVLFGIVPALLECIVRVPGTALRLRTDDLLKEADRSPQIRWLIERFVLAIFNQIGQTAACNRLHSLEQRCARWLLITDDSVGGDTIPVTHEFLAKLLGAQRAGVTLKLQALEESGLIRCGRGAMDVLDRRALEASACECYRVITTQFDRALMGPARSLLEG